MAKTIVLGHALPGDFFDADFADKYESATKSLAEETKEKRGMEYKSLGESMRAQCHIVKEYFDRIFGDGTSSELFGDSNNLKAHLSAVAELTEAAGRFKKEMNDLTNKYTQRQKAAQNREQFNRFVSSKKR